ncbi:phage holin family protein [Kingella kingae]|uniref:phage holin family protein n=1 Tax=Kingella kingae TaxID=504 RepID=UPI00254AC36B|nr:phage holin family protein [Kingella kingae]MDK4564973.1 phage holin family protein [Kingella kingae]MDK4578436.1 phage holin family protein [Kingella kingae]MDK4608567.1 phage holin family protein [Kingella kingae]MDK4626465.1 phage holin family protein [Kingella kingae]MDK4674291.1 phage holin family protein [Kingella kingae]
MTPMQYAAIQTLAGACALSILFFDKRGRAHKPIFAYLAYFTFLQMMSLVLAAHFKLNELLEWLLIFTLALQTGSVLLAGGNIGKIHASFQLSQFCRLLRRLQFNQQKKEQHHDSKSI